MWREIRLNIWIWMSLLRALRPLWLHRRDAVIKVAVKRTHNGPNARMGLHLSEASDAFFKPLLLSSRLCSVIRQKRDRPHCFYFWVQIMDVYYLQRKGIKVGYNDFVHVCLLLKYLVNHWMGLNETRRK